jgi:uncharacterized protein DUF2628
VKTYLVFELPGSARTLAAADRVVFLREKFSWPALVFTPFWLLWRRLWLGFLGWLVLSIAIAAGLTALGLKGWAGFAAGAIPSLIAGFEATALKRRKLVRRGFREVAVIVADDRDSAERRFFAAWIADAEKENPKAPPPAGLLPVTPSSGVIGLFPEPGGAR